MIFGDVLIQPRDILRSLSEEVELLADSYTDMSKSSVNTRWTKAVKTTLRALVERCGGTAVYTNARCSEFMLDFVSRDNRDGIEWDMIGAESEWRSHSSAKIACKEIVKDFRKLLRFKAPLKVMIFDYPSGGQDAVFAAIKDAIKRYGQHVRGERYVFVEYFPDKARPGYKYGCRGSIWVVRQDGPLDRKVDILFEPITADAAEEKSAGAGA